MCGIAGIVRYGEKAISESQIADLLTGNEHRGNDATGMAFAQADGSVQVFKKDEPAWTFVGDKQYFKAIEDNLKPDTWGVILHTRGATQGNPRKNENNHPMYGGLSAVIHNGGIRNDETLFNTLKMERSCETDSDILRAFVDRFGITEKCIKEMNRIVGAAAGAAIDPRHPKHMLLFRSGSPMWLASNKDYFMFASEKKTVYRALKAYVQRHGIWFKEERANAAFSPMADNTAWILGPEGLQIHKEFKTMVGQYIDPFRQTYTNYTERQRKWDILAKIDKGEKVSDKDNTLIYDEAQCPSCSRYWLITKNGNPKDFNCNEDQGGCGKSLVAIQRRSKKK